VIYWWGEEMALLRAEPRPGKAAHHAAGHAVALLAHGCSFPDIALGRDGGCGGRAAWRPQLIPSARAVMAEVVLLTGPAAELLHLAHDPVDDALYLRAATLFDQLAASTDLGALYLQAASLFDQLAGLADDDPEIGEAIHGQGGEAQARALHEAAKLTYRRWSAITRLADVLTESPGRVTLGETLDLFGVRTIGDARDWLADLAALSEFPPERFTVDAAEYPAHQGASCLECPFFSYPLDLGDVAFHVAGTAHAIETFTPNED